MPHMHMPHMHMPHVHTYRMHMQHATTHTCHIHLFCACPAAFEFCLITHEMQQDFASCQGSRMHVRPVVRNRLQHKRIQRNETEERKTRRGKRQKREREKTHAGGALSLAERGRGPAENWRLQAHSLGLSGGGGQLYIKPRHPKTF